MVGIVIKMALLGLVTSAQAALIPSRPTLRELSREVAIRVRIAGAESAARIAGQDLQFYESDESGNLKLAKDSSDRTEWQLSCQDGRVRALPRLGGQALELREPIRVSSPAGFIDFQGKPYRDAFVIRSAGSFCEVINEQRIEEYLRGVVNGEFSSKWNREAIAAQVIAARTYAYYQVRQARLSPDSHFDVDASVSDQVYEGTHREDAQAVKSVESTRGMILTVASSRDLQPLKTFYHSTCGGATELPQNVWGVKSTGFTRGVKCPFCHGSPRFSWTLDLDGATVKSALLRAGRHGEVPKSWPSRWMDQLARSSLQEILPGAPDASGRLQSVLTFWRGGLQLLVPATLLREWIGVGKFRSTAFEVSSRVSTNGENVWHFSGRGNGHGVGMCQWGAKVMGERGYLAASILKHYYPDAVLRKIW